MKLRQHDLFTRLLRARPLFMAALIYLGGCILGYALAPGIWICAAAAVFLAAGAALLRRKARRISAALLALLFLPLGAMNFRIDWHRAEPFEEQIQAELSGRICEMPVWREDTQRTICVLEDLSINGEPRRGNLRLYLRGDAELLQQVQLGQNIRCTAHIWQAEEAGNPGEFDFSRYLRLHGLRGYATAEIGDALLTPGEYRFGDWQPRLCESIGRRIDRLFPRSAALARAFLLGDRSHLSDAERDGYNQSGAGHLLAISGMHVSVLAGFIAWLLDRLLGRRGSYALTLMLLLFYGALIGFSASLTRAILMFAIYKLAPLAGRSSDAPTRIAAAMLVYLLLRPIAILDAGFILSYSASAGILLLAAPLSRLMHIDRLLKSKPRNGFRALLMNRLPKHLAQALLFSLSAQLATLPAVVHFFGAQPLWSLAANLIAVPLAMFSYVLALVSTIIGLSALSWLPDQLFALLTDCVRFFGDLPFASLRIARFPLWLCALCAIACFLASDLSRLPEKLRRFLPLTVILAVLISNGCAALTKLGCSIVFLDAGEADCAVVRAEGKVYLIDTGDAYSPAADYLAAMNYRPEGIFISHAHTDHAGGLTDILEICTPEVIWLSESWNHYEPSEEALLALEAAKAAGCRIETLSAGDILSLSEKTLLEVLSPMAGFQADSANDDSLVLRISYGDCSALFTGDASAELLEGCAGDCDLLKIAHHGARENTSAALLDSVSPSAAVIPVGYNTHGHPDKRVLSLLDAAECAVYRSDLHGAVTCRLREDGSMRISTYHTSEKANGLE